MTPNVAEARRLGRDVLFVHAASVDSENRFPDESIGALHAAGLLGYFVPEGLGGGGGSVTEYVAIGRELAWGCASTALVWVMHAHQLKTLVTGAAPELHPIVAKLAQTGGLVASVVTETGKGGDVFRAEAPLERKDPGRFSVRREAPMVSYGQQAEAFLVTMRAGPDRPPSDVELVLVTRDDHGDVEVTGDWEPMGMRGTRSVPMWFDVQVDSVRLLGSDYRTLVGGTLVPLAQIGWAAVWEGAARGALDRLVDALRAGHSPQLSDSGFRSRLAGLRARLDVIGLATERAAAILEEEAGRVALGDAAEDPSRALAMNGLKVVAADESYAVAGDLLEAAGLTEYGPDGPLGIGRTFRDLRSASMMFSNRRLLDAGGRLLIAERTGLDRVWRHRSSP